MCSCLSSDYFLCYNYSFFEMKYLHLLLLQPTAKSISLHYTTFEPLAPACRAASYVKISRHLCSWEWSVQPVWTFREKWCSQSDLCAVMSLQPHHRREDAELVECNLGIGAVKREEFREEITRYLEYLSCSPSTVWIPAWLKLLLLCSLNSVTLNPPLTTSLPINQQTEEQVWGETNTDSLSEQSLFKLKTYFSY